MKVSYFPFILVLLAVLLVSGCTSSGNVVKYADSNSQSTDSAEAVKSVDIFGIPTAKNWDADPEDDGIEITIEPKDMNGNLVEAAGTVEVSLYENTGTVLEQKRGVKIAAWALTITEDDYGFMSSNDLRMEFPNNMPKSLYGSGIIVVKFTTKQTESGGYQIFETEGDWGVSIPQYTEEEINQIYENRYLESAKNIGQTKTLGSFEVTIVRVGYFTRLYLGEEKTDFRVDIKVKNRLDMENSFYTMGAALIAGEKQYDSSLFDSHFDGTNIYPGVVKEGYIVFEGVPKNLKGQVNIIVGKAFGYNYNTDTFGFMVDL